MSNNLCKSSQDVAQFERLAKKAHEIVLANLKKDEDYEDAPEEFIGKTISKC